MAVLHHLCLPQDGMRAAMIIIIFTPAFFILVTNETLHILWLWPMGCSLGFSYTALP